MQMDRRRCLAGGGIAIMAAICPVIANGAEIDWSKVIARVSTALVRIECRRDVPGRSPAPPRNGSGFVIAPSGLVLTAAHVVAGATKITVSFIDGFSCEAALFDSQPLIDVAVLRMSGGGTRKPAMMRPGQPGYAIPGRPVIAIGCPLNYPFSASSGIVSGLDRSYSDQTGIFLTQHDAALNPGNSGGPLIGTDGRVLGINVATPPETQFDIGIGFAVPVEVFLPYLEAVVRDGHFAYSSFGLRVRRNSPSLARAVGAAAGAGLLVEKVLPDSAAAAAAMITGDLLIKVDGQPINQGVQLARLLWRTPPGTTLRLTIRRGDSIIERTIATESSQLHRRDRETIVDRFEKEPGAAGVSASYGLTVGDFIQPDGTRAVAISHVAEGSAASNAGLGPGDLILQLERYPVRDAQEAGAALARHKGDLLLLIARQGSEQQFVVLKQNADGSGQDVEFGAVY